MDISSSSNASPMVGGGLTYPDFVFSVSVPAADSAEQGHETQVGLQGGVTIIAIGGGISSITPR